MNSKVYIAVLRDTEVLSGRCFILITIFNLTKVFIGIVILCAIISTENTVTLNLNKIIENQLESPI